MLMLALAGCELQPVDEPTTGVQPTVPEGAVHPPAPLSYSTSLTPPPASMPDGVSYAGGDGSTPRTAVIVNGVTTARASTRAEYAWLRNRHPGFKRRDLKLVRANGRYYDAIGFDTAGGESRTVYFDVTATIGKR